ncbi:hypothetical protein BH11PSE13_BH11PSE13_20640 [soil metagenome]
MAAALIRTQSLTPDMLHTAFTLSLLRGLVIALVLLVLAWPLAAFNDEPRLKALLGVLALAPALRGLVSPRMVEFARAFNFRPDAVMELSAKAVAFIVSLIIAVTTRSYWAIAAATVLGPLVTTLLSYYFAPLRPRLTLIDWKYFSNLIGWNFVAQFGSALNWQIDRLLLPRVTTTTAFGQYAVGKQISEIPGLALIQPLARPAIATSATAGASQSSRYLQLSHGIALVMILAMGVPLLWPEVLIRIALGLTWLPAADLLRWISAVVLLGMPAVLMGPLAMTLDRTRLVAVRTLIELFVRLPLVWEGAVHFGLPGAIAGSAIATASGTLVSLLIVRSLASIGLMLQLKTIATPLAALLSAGAILYFSLPTVMAARSIFELVILSIAFGALYVIAYVLVVMFGWHLSGRPAGLENHLFKIVAGNTLCVRSVYQRSRSPASESPTRSQS